MEICHGECNGLIIFEPKGRLGFGYDPVFYVPSHDCSSAELPADVKNALSHRGQALRQLVTALQHYRGQ
jgi:XTP/dITP diphosphohydrolase